MPLQQHLDSIYEYLANEEDARVCRDLSAEACRVVPHNFFLIIAANTLSKLADSLANPKTVLAWMLEYMQAPLFLIGLLVPIRESGSMIPQLVIASWIRRMEFRKWAWIAGSLIQAASVTGMGITALYLQGHSAGWLVIGLLVLFSLGRGLCSVAFKDVLGKTIAKTRRGLLGGYSASISGYLGIAVGLGFLFLDQPGETSATVYATILIGTSILWLLAASIYAAVREAPGETAGGGNALPEALARMNLLLCSALTAPYYVVLAQDTHHGELSLLGLFIIANGLASSLSAPVWGRLADQSSKRVMIWAATLTGVLGIFTFLI